MGTYSYCRGFVTGFDRYSTVQYSYEYELYVLLIKYRSKVLATSNTYDTSTSLLRVLLV